MAQFYFLSILFNVTAGLILVYGKNLTESESLGNSVKSRTKKEKDAQPNKIKDGGQNFLFENVTFRLITGVLCAFVGLMKFLTVYKGDVPVVGDLIPAIAGITGGASLLFEYYIITTVDGNELPEKLKSVFVDGRKYIGIACLVAGLLHFILPQVVLL